MGTEVSSSQANGRPGLLERETRRVGESQVRMLTARAGELELDFPYGVMRQLLEPTLRATTGKQRAELLAGAAAPAGALLGGELPAIPSEGAVIDHGCYWLIANLAERVPLVLVLDDAHWADLASLRALVYLSRRLADLPAAVIVTTRSIQQEPRRGFVERPDAEAELIGALQASGLKPVAANSERVREIGPQSVMRSVRLRLQGLTPSATPVARGSPCSAVPPAPVRWPG